MVKLTQVKTTPQLEDLKRTYSSALYSYFRITNIKESYDEFRKMPTTAPIFRYSDNMSLAVAKKRLKHLRETLVKLDQSNVAEISFIEWRIAETLLLIEFRKIYESGELPTETRVKKYLKDQTKLYGELDPEIFGGIIRYIRILSRQRGDGYAITYKYFEKNLFEYGKKSLMAPKEETFLHYKHILPLCFPELFKVMSSIRVAEKYSLDEIKEIFTTAMKAVGADKDGWEVITSSGGTNIIAAKYRKKLIIGGHFHPTSTARFKQIIAHEIGCHVQRAIHDTNSHKHAQFDENDEGLAVVLEQLMSSRYTHKRVLRYLAICLAMGIDGKQRDFCEVYDFVWRTAYIIYRDKKHAKKQAFYETARAFRGGIPSAPGMIYIKDKIYLESNQWVWRKLETKLLSVNSFKLIFKSHNNLIDKESIT